jgi:hypothetical protein
LLGALLLAKKTLGEMKEAKHDDAGNMTHNDEDLILLLVSAEHIH